LEHFALRYREHWKQEVTHMQVPLTESEYTILDYLADGAQPLVWLVRELHGGRRAWETGAIAGSLARLAEEQLIRYCQSPGGPPFVNPNAAVINSQVSSILHNDEQHWWLELTEQGQNAWETWQQTQR